MTFKQHGEVVRTCEICQKQIAEDWWILELFRKESAQENPTQKLRFVHLVCAQQAIQQWLIKKWAKAKEA